ncbi:hypothetical protein ACP70R_049807 [Stipagrostis hirtigluma subsp. patula]
MREAAQLSGKFLNIPDVISVLPMPMVPNCPSAPPARRRLRPPQGASGGKGRTGISSSA